MEGYWLARGIEERFSPLREPTRSRTDEGKRRRLASVEMTVGRRF